MQVARLACIPLRDLLIGALTFREHASGTTGVYPVKGLAYKRSNLLDWSSGILWKINYN